MKIKSILTALLITLFLFSCKPIKIACVGDSITYGASIKRKDSLSYPAQLQHKLGDKYLVYNFGHSGATMLKKGDKPYWGLPEYQKALDFQPKIVILMLGTNDSKPQNWNHYKEDFITNYNDMIVSFEHLKSKPKIYIGIPPPVIKERWKIKKNIVEGVLTKKIVQIAKDNNLQLIDLQSIFKNNNQYFSDGIHPNVSGAELIADKIYKHIYGKN